MNEHWVEVTHPTKAKYNKNWPSITEETFENSPNHKGNKYIYPNNQYIKRNLKGNLAIFYRNANEIFS